MSEKRKGFGIWIIVVVVVVLGSLASVSIVPTPRSYRFVTVDHPVDMWQDGSDKWAYFSLGMGKTTDVASEARKELTALGFAEDVTSRPWFRFVKGNVEVVVCNHYEFAVNGSTLVANSSGPPSGATPDQWPCVLVKNGPGTDASLSAFQVKKLIHGW